MNELRMYVEHLFEGKVLTAENIELKEEIFGNLVARYEDYVAQGLSVDEALAKTKASITSVDDMLDEARDATDGDERNAAAPSAPVADSVLQPVAPAAPTVQMAVPGPVPSTGAARADGAAGAAGGPQVPGPAVGAAPVNPARKRWPLVVGIVAAVLVLLAAVSCGMGLVVEGIGDAHEDYIEDARQSTARTDGSGSPSVSVDNDGLHLDDGEGNSVDIGTGGISATTRDGEITIDGKGTVYLEGDLADELLTSVVNAGYADVEPYVGAKLSDAAQVEQLVTALPMADWAHGVDVTKGDGVLSLAYESVPHSYDGDSIDAALVYNATALMCAIPEVNEVQMLVSESDEPYEKDYYVFTREMLEGQYGIELTGDLVNADGWRTIKNDHLYKHDFIDHTKDRAERS